MGMFCVEEIPECLKTHSRHPAEVTAGLSTQISYKDPQVSEIQGLTPNSGPKPLGKGRNHTCLAMYKDQISRLAPIRCREDVALRTRVRDVRRCSSTKDIQGSSGILPRDLYRPLEVEGLIEPISSEEVTGEHHWWSCLVYVQHDLLAALMTSWCL